MLKSPAIYTLASFSSERKMDSSDKLSAGRSDKADRSTVIVDGRMSNLPSNSGEPIARNSLTSHSLTSGLKSAASKRPSPKESTNFAALSKIIKTEMCGEESEDEMPREVNLSRFRGKNFRFFFPLFFCSSFCSHRLSSQSLSNHGHQTRANQSNGQPYSSPIQLFFQHAANP